MQPTRPVDREFAAAIANADFPSADRLLKQGADVNLVIQTTEPDERGIYDVTTTYLIEAALHGHIETVRFLLEHGANPNISGMLASETPLMIAARRGHAELVDLLLDYGADFSVVDHPGKLTALEYAISDENAAIVRSLLAAGASPTFRRLTFSREGGTAAREIARMLVERGVDINKRDDWGRTPLMWAAEYAPLETVRFLIDSGADINIVCGKNMNGVSSNETALQLARRNRRNDVVALLQEHGARDDTSLVGRIKKSMGW